jgi:hypothetical protein
MNVQYRKIKTVSRIKEYFLIDRYVIIPNITIHYFLCFINVPIGYCNTETVAYTKVENFQ